MFSNHRTLPADSRRKFYAKYWMGYTLLFCLVALGVFRWYWVSGKTLIWEGDGWAQHYKALVYYGRYLRKIVRSLLFDHRLSIPDWDFHLSEGSDLLSALHYYAIGEPLCLLAVFCPTKYMHILYSFLMVLRLYLAGISFSVLCFGTGKRRAIGVCSGAIAYVFCYWAVFNAARHPFFLTPMIYFPLLILGIEKVFSRKSPVLLTVTVALAAVSNFYFFYMLVLLTVLYAVIRAIWLFRKNVVELLKAVGRAAAASAVGAMIAGALLVPILAIFLQDSRLSIEHGFRWLYPRSYYEALPSMFLTTKEKYWLCIGLAAPVVLSLFLLFLKRKKHTFLKILFAVCAVMILFPVFGQALNGFSYLSNRWSWAFALLCCYIFTGLWEDLLRLSPKQRNLLFFCGCGYFFICFWLDPSRSTQTFFGLCLLFITLFVLQLFCSAGKRRMLERALCLLVCVSVLGTGFWKSAPAAGDYASEAVDVQTAKEFSLKNETAAVKQVGRGGVVRYSGRSLTKNAGLLAGLSSTDYFWSISNCFVSAFRADLAMREDRNFTYEGYDDRAALLSLAGVNYFVTPSSDKKPLPYGFVKKGGKIRIGDECFTVSENPYALPLGYCYDQYITSDVWQTLSAAGRQALMTKAVCLSTPCDGYEAYSAPVEDFSLSYETALSDRNITLENNRVVTTAENTSITFTFDGLPNAETYFEVTGLDFDGTAEYELYYGDETVDPLNLYGQSEWEQLHRSQQRSLQKAFRSWEDQTQINLPVKASSGVSKSLTFRTKDHAFTSGRHDFLINLGYGEDPVTTVTVTFPYRGVYSFDSLGILCMPLDSYADDLAALKADTLQNITYGTDRLSGTVTLDQPKILCVAIPYSAGWRATVDGQETPVMMANGRYLGLTLAAGEHHIVLRYATPYKRAGLAVSALGLLLAAAYLIVSRVRRRDRTAEEKPLD